MDDVALANYVAGVHRGPVEMGRLDADCSRLLNVPCGSVVWFSDYTFIKLKSNHGEINFSHYHHMPSILLYGFLARGRDTNFLDFWWVQADGGFLVVLKATKSKEIYIQTFHAINLKEARRLHKRAQQEGRLIRVQPDAAGLLRPGTDHERKK